MKLVRVTCSPYPHDDGLPWEYAPDAFVSWADEVFDAGWRKPADAPFPTLEEAIDLVVGMGYEVEVVP
jgi:hypothetical protein